MFPTIPLPMQNLLGHSDPTQIPLFFWLVLLAPLVVQLVSIAIDSARSAQGELPDPAWPLNSSSHIATHD